MTNRKVLSAASIVVLGVSVLAAYAADAPTKAALVCDVYPSLAADSLTYARLVDLPPGVILRADGLILAETDIAAEIAKAPVEIQGQLRTNAFFLLEQMATQKLLAQEARRKTGTESDDEDALLQSYFAGIVRAAAVTDAEVAAFYAQNREMVGGMPLAQVGPQIKQYLLQGKQQALVEEHIRTLGRRTPIFVSDAWVDRQAQLARDNPVDKARANGRPTFASFGADTCIPCQKMAPAREAVRQKYDGKVNVVYVHVGKEQILASRYGVQGIPLVLFFDAAGREVLRHTGMLSQEQIEQQLKKMGVQ